MIEETADRVILRFCSGELADDKSVKLYLLSYGQDKSYLGAS